MPVCVACEHDNSAEAHFCAQCGSVVGEVGSGHQPIGDGRYVLSARLGAGGMGEVWRARDTTLDCDVALKILNRDLLANPEVRARMEREAKVLSRLRRSPHVVTLYDAFEYEERLVLVLDLIEGGDLRDRLDHGRLPWTRALEIATAISQGLSAMHAAGLIHRDLKPGNVLMDGELAMITDLGVVHDQSSRPLTRTGARIGTPEYMAPEQIQGKDVDARTDLYALGIVLYEMLTGVVPFTGPTDFEIERGHVQDPPDLNRVPRDVPEPVCDLLARCLEKDPAARFQSADEVTSALRHLATGETPSAAPTTAKPEPKPAVPQAARPTPVPKPTPVPEPPKRSAPTSPATPRAQASAPTGPSPTPGSSLGRNLGIAIAVVAVVIIVWSRNDQPSPRAASTETAATTSSGTPPSQPSSNQRAPIEPDEPDEPDEPWASSEEAKVPCKSGGDCREALPCAVNPVCMAGLCQVREKKEGCCDDHSDCRDLGFCRCYNSNVCDTFTCSSDLGCGDSGTCQFNPGNDCGVCSPIPVVDEPEDADENEPQNAEPQDSREEAEVPCRSSGDCSAALPCAVKPICMNGKCEVNERKKDCCADDADCHALGFAHCDLKTTTCDERNCVSKKGCSGRTCKPGKKGRRKCAKKPKTNRGAGTEDSDRYREYEETKAPSFLWKTAAERKAAEEKAAEKKTMNALEGDAAKSRSKLKKKKKRRIPREDNSID